jgi:lipopolysaccharide export system permease protein
MRLIDSYILRRLLAPLGASLCVVVAVLLLERSLRLFALLAESGGPVALVIEMTANLIPHYLGLALPSAFFISMLVVIARFDEDSELDAFRGAGLSLFRVSLPFFGIAAFLTAFGFLLYGYLQPYSRYDYRALFHVASAGAWDGTLQGGVFLSRSANLTISADAVDSTGRNLTRVFVYQAQGNQTIVTTAARGVLQVTDDGQRAVLRLQDGVQLVRGAFGESPARVTFSDLIVNDQLNTDLLPFRPRGNNEREMTLGELRRELSNPSGEIRLTRVAAELHARIVRSLSPLILPLVAVPLGLAGKRSQRGYGITIAAILLIAYHHALLLGESLADIGRIPAALGAWPPLVIFAAFGLWVFERTNRMPDGNPLQVLVGAGEAAVRGLGILRPRMKRAQP